MPHLPLATPRGPALYCEPKQDLLVAASDQLHSAAHVPGKRSRRGNAMEAEAGPSEGGALIIRHPSGGTFRRLQMAITEYALEGHVALLQEA